MMEKEYIKLRRERDFGEAFNATFAFIKQEFNTIGKAILFFIVPVILVCSILMIEIQSQLMEVMKTTDIETEIWGFYGRFFKVYSLMFIAMLVLFTVTTTTVFAYFKAYDDKGPNNFTVNDVFTHIKKHFLPVFFSSVLLGLLIMAGFMLCFLPGIYLAVSLSLVYAIMIIEKENFGDAFSKSFRLTGVQWWYTFLMIFVVFIIISILSYLLAIPSGVMNFSKMMNNVLKGINPYETLTTTDIIISTLASMVTYVLYVIPNILIGFQYFNLIEITEKTTLQERINQIDPNA